MTSEYMSRSTLLRFFVGTPQPAETSKKGPLEFGGTYACHTFQKDHFLNVCAGIHTGMQPFCCSHTTTRGNAGRPVHISRANARGNVHAGGHPIDHTTIANRHPHNTYSQSHRLQYLYSRAAAPTCRQM